MGCVGTKRVVINKIEDTTKSINKEKMPSMKVSFKSNNMEELLKQKSQNIKIKNLIHKGESKVDDNYKILSKLGKGAFGSVFKVLHNKTGLIRAMKIIKKEHLSLQDDDQSFLKEIEILINCEHPNIIKIYEYYWDNINYYIITEFVSGGELYETILNWKSYDEEKAGYIMSQLLSAVNYLHSKKIVHRDIKPENMLVENKMKAGNEIEIINIKLIDFGTCNFFDKSKKLTLKVGSPYYIAPEVLNRNYDEKCDIWSCGVMLYIMLVGYPPFSGNSTEELLKNVKEGKVSFSGPEWKKVKTEAKDLVTKMLKLNSTERISAENALKHSYIQNIEMRQNQQVDSEYVSDIFKNIRNFNSKEKLQQATSAYIVHFLYSAQEIDGLKKVFKIIDKNGDGRLTYQELKLGFEKVFGTYLSNLELDKIIADVDGDNDGYISYEEFLRVTVNQKQLFDDKNLKIAFDKFDVNKDGKLSKEELKKVLGTSNLDYINILLNFIDMNGDGFISYDEFVSLMKGVAENTVVNSRNATNFTNTNNLLSGSKVENEQNKIFDDYVSSSENSKVAD